jgi:hypothetical protein
MKCEQCGAKVKYAASWMIDAPGRPPAVLCSADCARSWLGADRPLTRRLAAAEKAAAGPQDVVVYPGDLMRQCGETKADFEIRQGIIRKLLLG